MRRPGVQLAGVLLSVFMLVMAGCGSSADSPGGPATRDPLSPTDQASAQLTKEQAEALEAACSKGEAVPGVSACPEAVQHAMAEARGKGACTRRTHFCIKSTAIAKQETLVTMSCPDDPSSCSEVAPDLTQGKVLPVSVRSLTSPVEQSSTSPPETTEPVPTTEPPPTESSPAS